jgi:hypothetical protein
MAKICVTSNYRSLIRPTKVTTGEYNTGANSPELTITSFHENYAILGDPLVNINGIVVGTGRTANNSIKLFVPIPVSGKQNTVVPGVTILNNVVEDVRITLHRTLPPNAEIDIKTVSQVDEQVKIVYQFSYFTH